MRVHASDARTALAAVVVGTRHAGWRTGPITAGSARVGTQLLIGRGVTQRGVGLRGRTRGWGV